MCLYPQAKEILTVKLPSWQDKCTDATRVPDTVISMIENLRTPMSVIPESSPTLEHSDRVSPMLEHDVPPFNLHMTMFKCLLTLWHFFFFLLRPILVRLFHPQPRHSKPTRVRWPACSPRTFPKAPSHQSTTQVSLWLPHTLI